MRVVVTSTSAAMILMALAGTPVLAQQPAAPVPEPEIELEDGGLALPRGLVLTPSLGLFGFYDDNVFVMREFPQESGGARLTGGLALSQTGRRVGLSASYSFASDVFAQFPEIDDLLAAQSASVALSYQAGRRTNGFLRAGYSMSRRPGDLFPDTGLSFLRAAAENYSSGAGLTRQFGRDGQVGFSYTYSVLVSARRAVEERPSETWSLNLSKKVGRRTTVAGSGGVRNIEGRFQPTYSVSITHARRETSLGLGYSYGTYVIPTLEGSTESESLRASFSWRPGRFSLGVFPRVSLNADSRRLVRTFSLGAVAAVSVGRWASLELRYAGRAQRRVETALDPVEPRGQELVHNTVYLGVAFSRPFRLR